MACFSLCLGLNSCGGITPDQRVELHTQVTSSSTPSFQNAFGWTVHVEGAWMSIAALRLLEGEALERRTARLPEDLADQAPLPPLPTPQRRWFDYLVSTAYAHPGHYQEGNVVAEMLTPASVDLGRTTALAPSQAVTLQPRSGKVVFASPASGAHAHRLQASILRVMGRAVPGPDHAGAQAVYFDAEARSSDWASAEGPLQVPGCPFDGGQPTQGATLQLDVDWILWFDQVDFSDLPPGSEAEPSALRQSPRSHGGFLRGIAKATAYRFHLLEKLQ
jgi:hypothetical protein